MEINTNELKNKQRIFIGGNQGASEIYDLTKKILTHINKPADFVTLGEPLVVTDAPVVLIKEGANPVFDENLIRELDIHILLVHNVLDNISANHEDFEQYIAHLEQIADGLPKAGSLLYFEEDHVATMMGKKERTDVKNIEYSSLKSQTSDDGLIIELNGVKVELNTSDKDFAAHAGGARALLNRIGVSDEQFLSGLKNL